MVRAKSSPAKKRSNKRVFKRTKGFVGGQGRLRRTALGAVVRALQYAFKGRKQKKRKFRELWITRLNAASRMRGLPYNRLIEGLRKANITLDRRSLAEIAVTDPKGFDAIVDLAKSKLK